VVIEEQDMKYKKSAIAHMHIKLHLKKKKWNYEKMQIQKT